MQIQMPTRNATTVQLQSTSTMAPWKALLSDKAEKIDQLYPSRDPNFNCTHALASVSYMRLSCRCFVKQIDDMHILV